MVKHIVFFGIADQTDGVSKAAMCALIKTELENLMGLIPELKKIDVGINQPELGTGNFDLSLYSEFNSWSDLDIYQVHPEHKRVAAIIGKAKTSRACVDYED